MLASTQSAVTGLHASLLVPSSRRCHCTQTRKPCNDVEMLVNITTRAMQRRALATLAQSKPSKCQSSSAECETKPRWNNDLRADANRGISMRIFANILGEIWLKAGF